MDSYTVSGELEIGREVQEFSRTVEAGSESHAREIVYSELGSEHSVSRGKISIEAVEEA